MILVVPDTNFLIYSAKHGINIDYELERLFNIYKVVILRCVREELEKLRDRLRGKERYSVSLLLSLIRRYDEENEDIPGRYTDEIIVNYALRCRDEGKKVVVCTNDKELKGKLLDIGIPVVVVKQKKYFELQGYI
ncbi:ribonuclease VapC [Methanofervidicoccus sp. A16]|uniref:type II toxin-antitoxin system VapC family toxin n=1 Tax=Methanofervidicoccus sp. A16 TaxID=2607662 RepID=UPI001188E958|nr:PIN domain-containing protein [Methanofervidicoccus sp. A16]AXI24750.1 ribonuclease VapC [Methanofervidicoccus sp. A16]MBW9219871.1 ribonuclease VapC [Methanothermococcus sp. SCGC AD-155-N22]